jgi:hypothetical protein
VSGDYNLDGFANAADYVWWRKIFGAMGLIPYTGADGDGDSDVDDDDNDVWQENFGEPPPAPSPISGESAAEIVAAATTQADEMMTELSPAKKHHPVRVDIVAPSAPRLPSRHPAIRRTHGDTTATTVSLSDAALLDWLDQSETKPTVSVWQSSELRNNEESRAADEVQFDAVNQVFAQLSSG